MQSTRARMPTRSVALVLVLVFAAGCSSSEPTEAQLYDDARELGAALTDAVSAARDASTGFGDPGVAAQTITRASSAGKRLSNTAAGVDDLDVRNLGFELALVADRVVGLLVEGAVREAERVRTGEFVPAASELTGLQGDLAAGQPDRRRPPGLSPTLTFVALVMLVGGAAAFLMRGHKRPSVHEGERRESEPPTPDSRPERSWDAPHPLYPVAEPVASAQHEDIETSRTARVRPLEVELHELMVSTIEQVHNRGWEVALMCPDVHISGDPIRIQRALLSVLGKAFLAGANRVGIVVENLESGVLLSVGHDAPFEEADGEDVAVRFVDQLRHAVSVEELDWSFLCDDGVSLITVSLGQALVVKEPAESGA